MPLTSVLSTVIDLLDDFDGRVGISGFHIPSQTEFEFNAHERFPLASTSKLPLAVYLMRQVEKGLFDLNEYYEVKESDLRPGGILDKRFDYPGVKLSYRNLIRLMLEMSDNTATDILGKKVGNIQELTHYLEDLELSGISINRSCEEMLYDQAGIPRDQRPETFSLSEWDRLEKAVPFEDAKSAALDFLKDPRDTCTPLAMTRFLRMLWGGELLGPRSREFILSCLQRCQTGKSRMRALLPPAYVVSDKTGSASFLTNDVGIIEWPLRKEVLLLSIYISDSSESLVRREQLCAQIAKALTERAFGVQREENLSAS